MLQWLRWLALVSILIYNKMKNLLIIVMLLVVATGNSFAQKNKNQEVKYAASAGLKTDLDKFLHYYLNIKDALVKGDFSQAKAASKKYFEEMTDYKMEEMTADQKSFARPLLDKIKYDLEHMSNAPNIDHVREHFSSLSDSNWKIFKAFGVTKDGALYLDYCPMEKANWISSEKPIQNPYYGSKMMTCGNVKETIN